MDKAKPLAQIAAEECHEEAGYVVAPERLQEITCVYGGVGLRAGCLTIFYVEVSDADIEEGAGGGLREDGEFLDVLHLPVAQAAALLQQDAIPLPTGLFGALEWFLARRKAAWHPWDTAVLVGSAAVAAAAVGYWAGRRASTSASP